ncbi:MAG: cysteine synthase A [Microbacteriaceae bacterium]
MSAKIYNNITEAFGNTPLVRLNRLTEGLSASVLLKLEFYNPAGSVKDRLAIAIIRAAEASGELKPGGTLVEATSGNTGIGLSMAAAALGYRVIITMPENLNVERRQLIRAYGAEVHLTPVAEGMKGAIARAEALVAETPGAIMARQFENEANVRIHRETTAEEIWADTDGAVDIFVAGVGTGGTLSGVGQVLKEKKPSVRVVAVEPLESPLLSAGTVGPHKIPGIGAGFIPDVLDQSVYDQVFTVPSDSAAQTARDLATQEGILGGISSGAAAYAAIELAKLPENAGKVIVAVIPDFGERYLSTYLFHHTRDAE